MEPHCSMLQKILRFGTSHKVWILVFRVSNSKYLAFDTPDSNALMHLIYILKVFLYNSIVLTFNL